jgi:hypothetical protein
MEYTQVVRNGFYQSLGKLFYAIAMADKIVRPVEVEKLRENLKRHWIEIDDVEDEFGSDAAYQIEIVFSWLQDEEKSGEDYYKEFHEYYKEHKTAFTSDIKLLIWQTADAIAYSYAGRNKAELVVLNKLRLLFEWHDF